MDRDDQDDEQDRAGEIIRADREIRRLLNTDRLAEAGNRFDESLTMLPTDLDRWSRAAILTGRAVIAWRLRRIPLALELAAEGWTDIDNDIDNDLPNEPRAAMAMGFLGYLLAGIGHHRAAMTMLRMAVEAARETGDEPELAVALQRLGGTINFEALGASPATAGPLFAESGSCSPRG
ncbi:hypothetical protein GCM10029964_005420 [Kibdelosporangium lantanae]